MSQYLLRDVVYGPDPHERPDDIVFRVLLFKLFNKVSTWEGLRDELGELDWQSYEFEKYARVLDSLAAGGPIYSAAYVMPPPKLGEERKHRNHLRLLEAMMRSRLADALTQAQTLEEVYLSLASFPSVGPFLAYQFAIDLNYTPVLSFSEDEFVVPGPGARDGIRKCFGPASRGIEEQLIAHMVRVQENEFARLGLDFPGLFGRRLHLIDCQNLFCEVDKYSRVAHPEIAGISGRSRIKQSFKPQPSIAAPTFPPEWGIALDAPSPLGLQHQTSLL